MKKGGKLKSMLLRLDAGLMRFVEEQAKRCGLSKTAYIRLLLIIDRDRPKNRSI